MFTIRYAYRHKTKNTFLQPIDPTTVSIEMDLQGEEWDKIPEMMLEHVIAAYIPGAGDETVELLFQFGRVRGKVGVQVHKKNKNAYFRSGRVLTIRSMMVTPKGNNIIDPMCRALLKDESLQLACVRIESILDDGLLAKFLEKGWVLNNPLDNSPLLKKADLGL